MHIAEGYLPVSHAFAWTAASLPCALWSCRSLDLPGQSRPKRLLVAASAGFLFAMTAMKFPSVAGSSSHPTGIALGTVLLGVSAMPVLALIVLLFQALLMAHGGLTTLGANLFALGVAGPWAVRIVWGASQALRIPEAAGLAAASVAGSLATYAMTSLQLALAFPDPASGLASSFVRFGAIFALAQTPVAVAEAFFTLLVWRSLQPGLRKAVAR